MMDSGSALGSNWVLIKNQSLNPKDNDLIAIPENIPLQIFLNYAYPELQNKREILFRY